MEKKPTSATVMGLLVGLVLVVLKLVTYFTEAYVEPWSLWAFIIVNFLAILVCVLLHANENQYRDSFGGLFGFGFKASAAAIIVMIAYVIMEGIIFPDVKTRFLEVQRAAAYNTPEASANREAIEQGFGMLEKNYTFMMTLGTVFWMLVAGALGSLLGAAMCRKNMPGTKFDNI